MWNLCVVWSGAIVLIKMAGEFSELAHELEAAIVCDLQFSLGYQGVSVFERTVVMGIELEVWSNSGTLYGQVHRTEESPHDKCSCFHQP